MKNNEKTELEPRVLIISNNPFSKTDNNGKTLASFFKSFNADNIAQLYFKSEKPTEDFFKNYFQVSDISMLKSIFNRKIKSGVCVNANRIKTSNKNSNESIFISSLKRIIIKSNVIRLIRELIWRVGSWESEELINWIDGVSPEIVFFCAGDSEFPYRITNRLAERFKSKLVIYITDDYILPRKTLNAFWGIRRNRVLNNIKSILEISDLFFTVSKKMSDV